MASLRASIAAILVSLGLSRAPSPLAQTLPEEAVARVREERGGNIQLIPFTQTRWYLEHVETASASADLGNLEEVARLMRAARGDGVLSGVLATRTGGLVRLPKRFRGEGELVQALTGGTHRARSVFAEMAPDTELALLAADGVLIGVGVGELLEVEGRMHPVLVRLDPEFLRFNWAENQWYYRSAAGLLAITPGDGRWVLHTPGGALAPWQHGIWRAIGKAFIRKDHASMHRDNWEAKLANPARVATAPAGASEQQAESWFKRVLAWGKNTVFGLVPGYDVKLLESNGRGADSFPKTIEEQKQEMVLAVTGQTVTTDGGAGFSNADVHQSIKADIIKADADALAITVNTQILPAWVIANFGADALRAGGVVLEWDVTPPRDRNIEASALVTASAAIKGLTEALAAHGETPNVRALCDHFGIPLSVEKPSPGALRLVASNGQTTTDQPAVAA